MPAATLTLRGSTTPRIFTPPLVKGRPGPCGCGCALTPRTSLGFSVVEFAWVVLGIRLLPWQRWLLIHAMELLPDRRFRFRTVLVLVARQNGKTTLIEVKNLWKMFVLKVPLIIGTAQILDYAEESWDKAVEIVESIPELAAHIAHVDRTNGKKALRLIHGSRWKIATATRKGGRSLSADDVNLDELREHHTWESWAAVTKTTMARRKAQVWAATNAGDDRSVVLNSLQEKGHAAVADPGSDSTLGIFEWSAPDNCPIDDPQMWRLANPSLGYPQGISMEALQSALETDPEPIFRTECLCQRVPDLTPSKIPLTAWVKCDDAKSTMVGGLVLCWQVSWDRSRGAIGVAGHRPDGVPHFELIDYRDGTKWMPGRMGAIAKAHNVAAVVYSPTGPGASLKAEITERLPIKLDPKPMNAREQANGCGRLYDLIDTKGVWHLGDDRLLDMLRRSATRDLGGAWVWDMRHSAGDISGLEAITDALQGLNLYGKQPPPAPAPQVIRAPAYSETLGLAKAGF